MKLSKDVKPISYLKAHATEILRQLNESGSTVVITQHGEAKAVLQDIAVYEQTQESMAMLKMLAQSTASLEKGHYRKTEESFSTIRDRVAERRK